MADLLLFINIIITCKYYAFSWEIHTHTQTHAHINKLPTTMTAGNKQKQLLNEWSEWQKAEGKREEVKVKGETRGWCWSSIEISFNWAFCGFNWKLCFLLLLLLIEAAASAAAAPSAAALGCYGLRSSSGNHFINKQKSTKREGGRRRCNQREEAETSKGRTATENRRTRKEKTQVAAKSCSRS